MLVTDAISCLFAVSGRFSVVCLCHDNRLLDSSVRNWEAEHECEISDTSFSKPKENARLDTVDY